MIVDNEEFYEQEKPLSLNDIRSLVIILKQVLVILQFWCLVCLISFSEISF